MARYLITQSLLSSWNYMFDCFEGYEDEAHEEFMQTLRREKGEQSEAMLKGIAFENLCYSIADGSFRPGLEFSGPCNPNTGEPMERQVYPFGYQGACKVAEYIKNAPVQVRSQREITVDGMDFLVYGVLDALKAGTIYDVKFKNKSFGSLDLAGSYLDSPQHPAYFYIVPEASEFKYLVSDGTDIYTETYRREDTPYIGDIIHDFIDSLAGWGLLDLYKEKWLTK